MLNTCVIRIVITMLVFASCMKNQCSGAEKEDNTHNTELNPDTVHARRQEANRAKALENYETFRRQKSPGFVSVTLRKERLSNNSSTPVSWEWTPPSSTFPITAWVAPEVTQERMAEFAEAGFTLWKPNVPCSRAQNLKALDLAQANGIKALVFDSRLINYWEPHSYHAPDRIIQEVVDDYSKTPAFYGYLLRDEPSAAHFQELGYLVGKLKEKDPEHLAYINLLPDYANNLAFGTPEEQMQADSYEDYLSQFFKTVHPQVLSYDNYMWTYSLYPGYRTPAECENIHFRNMEIIRKYGLSNSTRYWYYTYAQDSLAGSKGINVFIQDQYSLNRQVYSALAYGYTGISYYTYLSANGMALIHDGKRTYIYDLAKQLNREIQHIGKPLLNAVSLAVYHVNGAATDVVTLDNKYVNGSANIVIGVFVNIEGINMLMFMNKDNAMTEVEVNVEGKYRLEQKSKMNDNWIAIDSEIKNDNMTTMIIQLDPGSGELVRCLQK